MILLLQRPLISVINHIDYTSEPHMVCLQHRTSVPTASICSTGYSVANCASTCIAPISRWDIGLSSIVYYIVDGTSFKENKHNVKIELTNNHNTCSLQ